MKILTLLFLIATSLKAAALVPARNQEITNFHFSQCSDTHCLELWSTTGLMSQLQFSFSTVGATHVRITDLKTKIDTLLEGTDATYIPRLKCITLAQANGASSIISLDDFKVERFH